MTRNRNNIRTVFWRSLIACLLLLPAGGWEESVAAAAPCRPGTCQNVELVGQFAGHSDVIAVQGNYAYVGVNSRLIILDVADPARPRKVSELLLWDFPIEDIAVSGTYVYVAAGLSYLQIVDVSNPASPQQVAVYQPTPKDGVYGVAVRGAYAYVAADAGGLKVVDISTPGRPQQVGSSRVAWARRVAIDGQYAYVVTRWGGLVVVDVADPTNPTSVGFHDEADRTGASPRGTGYATHRNAEPDDRREFDGDADIAVSNGYAYLTTDAGFRVLSLASPAQPAEVGRLEDGGYRLALQGQFAYLAAAEGLRVVSLADPTQPFELALQWDGAGVDVAAAGNHVYIAAGPGGVEVASVANPAQPVYIGHYNTPGEIWDVTVNGDYLYLSNPSGFRIVSVASSANPTETGFLAGTRVDGSQWTGVFGSAVREDYAYIATGGLSVVRVADPRDPQEVGHTDPQGTETSLDLAVSGNYAYVYTVHNSWRGSWGEVRVVNVADPTRPTQEGYFRELNGGGHGIAVSGNYLYVADGYGGIWVLNIANPPSPVQVARYDTPGQALSVVVSDNLAYVADGTHGLLVLDISDPVRPRRVGGFLDSGWTSYYFWDIAESDGVLYAATGDYGLLVINVANPAEPVKAGFYYTPGEAVRVAASNGYAYVAAREEGLFIFRHQAADSEHDRSVYLPLIVR